MWVPIGHRVGNECTIQDVYIPFFLKKNMRNIYQVKLVRVFYKVKIFLFFSIIILIIFCIAYKDV